MFGSVSVRESAQGKARTGCPPCHRFCGGGGRRGPHTLNTRPAQLLDVRAFAPDGNPPKRFGDNARLVCWPIAVRAHGQIGTGKLGLGRVQ